MRELLLAGRSRERGAEVDEVGCGFLRPPPLRGNLAVDAGSIVATANTGSVAIYGKNSGGGAALTGEMVTALTSAPVAVQNLIAHTIGSMADNFGLAMSLCVQDASTGPTRIAAISATRAVNNTTGGLTLAELSEL